VDTGSQISCLHSDVIYYLCHRGERSTFSPCSLSCFLAEVGKVQFSDAVRLHVPLLIFRAIIISVCVFFSEKYLEFLFSVNVRKN